MGTKRTNETTARDGFSVLREGLMQRASRLPEFDADYVNAALTILRTALEIKNYYSVAFLNRVDLTPARLSLLMALFLCADRPPKASELGELLVVSPGNITGLVDGLAKDRLVHRIPDPGDRRAVLVELTDKGRRFVRWLAPIHFRLIRLLLSSLGKAQARSLTTLLDEVRNQVRNAPPPTITRRPSKMGVQGNRMTGRAL